MNSVTFTLQGEYIELIALLKVEGIAPTGGYAKIMVAEGLVQVNGVVESRKRYKVRQGDVVIADGNRITVI